MKKHLFLFILVLLPMMASAENVMINETNFPDSNFRNWLLSQDYGADGILTDEELKNITDLDVRRLEIHDLKGIEYFTALKVLNCITNKLTALDLSNNIALEKLNCLGNRLTTINLQENKKLRYLSCVSNQLTALDISGCTELDTLACSNNQLTALDVSMNTKLISLECYSNQLSTLDLSKNTALRRIHCNNNQLTTLDVSKNTALTLLQCSTNLLTTLDVTKNPALKYLSCTDNKLTTLHVSNNKSLESITCFHNQLTSLDASGCSSLKTLSCSYNQLTTLDLSGCSALEELGCNDNQLTTLDLSENTALTTLFCYQNQIKGAGMDALVESLPTVSEGSLNVMYFENEQNVMTSTQVATAKAKGWTPYLCTYSFSEEYAGSETSPKYFPTGMTWEEVGVTPDMGQEYNNAHIYEISTDTIISNVTYRKVLKDNVFSGLCVRESGDKVWLLTKEYPTEILLYNFDWDSNQEIVTEYLKGQSLMDEYEEYEVRQETTPVGNSQTVVIDGKTYQYYMKRLSGTIIRGIGKVAELNRYPCLLSYREPAVIHPGLDYHKVHWIKRNGVEIFRSESAKEWTEEMTAYYYYKGEKVPLTLNEKKICVSIPKDCGNIIERFLANTPTLDKIRDELFEIYLIRRSDYNKLTMLDFWAEDTKSVILTSSYYTENNEEICTTPYLDVRLKKEEDVDLLTSYAEQYKLNIVKNSPLMPLWYILNITPDSEKNTLECANALYESGDFAESVPDFAYDVKIEEPYRPFVEEGKVWKVGDVTSGNPVQHVDYYYFEGDTIIDGITCKQMMSQRFVNPEFAKSNDIPQDNSLSYVGAWYEEMRKVYMYDPTRQQFKLMYDFSHDISDTLQIDNHLYVVGPKEIESIKGFKGAHWDVRMCTDGESIYSPTWLEGVGSTDCPINNVYPGYVDPLWFLMSCGVGDEVIYYNDEYEDGATPAGARKNRFDFTHTIKEKPKTRIKQEESDACISSFKRDVARPKVKTRISRGEEQSLYGEYNDLQLGINLDLLDDAYQVSITNDSGKVVYEKAVNAGSIVGLNIDISKYPEGNYTVTVENSNESFTGEFKAQLTGIEEVRSKKIEAKGHIYNLQGQRLSRLQKGLNIVNGQKIYIK